MAPACPARDSVAADTAPRCATLAATWVPHCASLPKPIVARIEDRADLGPEAVFLGLGNDGLGLAFLLLQLGRFEGLAELPNGLAAPGGHRIEIAGCQPIDLTGELHDGSRASHDRGAGILAEPHNLRAKAARCGLGCSLRHGGRVDVGHFGGCGRLGDRRRGKCCHGRGSGDRLGPFKGRPPESRCARGGHRRGLLDRGLVERDTLETSHTV